MTPSPAPGREALNTEVRIYNSLLIQKSRHQSQVSRGNHSVALCQEDNEVLWPLVSVTVCAGETGTFEALLLSMPQQALMIQCCGFILGPRNSHLLGTGSRLGTIREGCG